MESWNSENHENLHRWIGKWLFWAYLISLKACGQFEFFSSNYDRVWKSGDTNFQHDLQQLLPLPFWSKTETFGIHRYKFSRKTAFDQFPIPPFPPSQNIEPIQNRKMPKSGLCSRSKYHKSRNLFSKCKFIFRVQQLQFDFFPTNRVPIPKKNRKNRIPKSRKSVQAQNLHFHSFG
jgi:hypothetical protein